jgi:hypothetical protein
MLLTLKEDCKARGGSDEEARSLELTTLTQDGSKMVEEIGFDHNKKLVLGLTNTTSMTDTFKSLASDSNEELLIS